MATQSRPDSVEEHARIAEYRRTLQRLRVVIRTLNRDCTMYCVKYSVHYALLLGYALLFYVHTARIVSWSSRTWQKSLNFSEAVRPVLKQVQGTGDCVYGYFWK